MWYWKIIVKWAKDPADLKRFNFICEQLYIISVRFMFNSQSIRLFFPLCFLCWMLSVVSIGVKRKHQLDVTFSNNLWNGWTLLKCQKVSVSCFLWLSLDGKFVGFVKFFRKLKVTVILKASLNRQSTPSLFIRSLKCSWLQDCAVQLKGKSFNDNEMYQISCLDKPFVNILLCYHRHDSSE